MYLRLLLLFVLACAAVTLIKSWWRQKQSGTPKGSGTAEGENLVRDPQCGSYVAEKDAINLDGRLFCSHECAQKYLAR